MYSVQPFCRYCIYLLLLVVCAAYKILSGSNLLFWAYIPFCIWLWFYFKGLKIQVTQNSIIKKTGSIMRRRLVIKRRAISCVKSLTIRPMLPGLLRVYYMGENIYLIGLNGAQIKSIVDILN